MKRILLAIGCLAAAPSWPRRRARSRSSPQPPRPKVLAFFTRRRRARSLSCSRSRRCGRSAASAGDGGYAFAATSDWDALNDANLRDVRVVIWLNDMPHTPAQRQAFERYMAGGGAWLGFHVSGFGTNAWPWFTEFMGGGRFSASNWPSLPARVNVDDAGAPDREGRAADVRRANQRVVLVDAEPARQSRRQGAADAGRARIFRSA